MFLTHLFESTNTQLIIKNGRALQYFNKCINAGSRGSSDFLPRVDSVDGSRVTIESLQGPNVLTRDTIQSLVVEPIDDIEYRSDYVLHFIVNMLAYAIRYQAHSYIINDKRYTFVPQLTQAIDLIHSISSDCELRSNLIAFRGNQLVILFPFGN